MRIGEVISLCKCAVTTRQIVMYAGASGDFNPIHYDHLIARQAGLGGVIAHGMLSMGFAAQMVGEAMSEHGWVREIRARFLSPVRPGDVVALGGQIVSIEREGRQDEAIRLELHARVDGRAVLRGTALVARHPVGGA
jgi:acyl dehydratase